MADKESLQQMYLDMLQQLAVLQSSGLVTTLTNANFTNGTYIISKPGVYRLTENIVFNPNNLAQMTNINPQLTSYESSDVLPTQFTTAGGIYDPAAFGIGFFAAISVITSEPTLIDLNGHSIEQSKEHNLQQRFYANIELADQPFISSQGPHDFGTSVASAKNCYIINGTIGRSSHHGIHGNACENILIQNVTFKDYEVAPCAINGGKNITIYDCTASGSKTNIPVLGIWSSARFIRPYINALADGGYTGTLNIGGCVKNALTLKLELKNAMNNVYDDLIISNRDTINSSTHPDEYKLFTNAAGVVDGNSYGFLFNSLGVAVNGFPSSFPSNPSQNVYMVNVVVNNHRAKINEIAALPSGQLNTNVYGSGEAQIDPVGSLFQTQNKDPNGNNITIDSEYNYLGNVVANAQAMVAKGIYENFSFGHLDTTRMTITPTTINWVNGEASFLDVVPNKIFKCNGDSMFHVNKGVVVFKMDACDNVYMYNCTCTSAMNSGDIGGVLCDQDYLNKIGLSHSDATYFGYGGANVRGWSFASSKNVTAENCTCNILTAYWGFVYGFDIHQASENIELVDCTASNLTAGAADSTRLQAYNNNPTPLPVAIGFHVEEHANNITFCNPTVNTLNSPYKTVNFSINTNTFYEVNKCDLE